MVLYDPARYGEYSVRELLDAAAHAHIGMDRRLVQSILDRGEAAIPDALAFRRNPEEQRVDIGYLLVDLIRYWKTPEGLDILLEEVRFCWDDITDELVMAFLPFGEKAIEPLLKLYEELGEESGSEVAFLLAGLQVRDPRILEILIERLEYDASDGAFCLGLYGDPAARPALEAMLSEIPEDDKELRHELTSAIEQLGEPHPYQEEPFDILKDYPERELPPVDQLDEEERLAMLEAADAEVRAAAAYSFFNHEVQPKVRLRLLELVESDPDPAVRGRAWMSLADATEDEKVRQQMIAVAADASREVAERGGAAVGLYAVAERDDVQAVLDALYQEGGTARARALEAMWRSLWKPYARYFAEHLDDPDKGIVRQALRGAGYFQLTQSIDKIASYFDRDDDMADLREDALFAYALAMPGETTRGRVKGMFRKVEDLAAGLDEEEASLVMFALDERLQLHGLAPVFTEEANPPEALAEEPAPEQAVKKVGRNDPCPCGSGKKYKKCHGA